MNVDEQPNTPTLRAKEIPLKKKNKYKGTRRGRFAPKHPEKYEGRLDNIIYRSKMELRMMKRLDDHVSVLKWSSEEVIVPYFSPIDKQMHRYFVDFKVTKKCKDGMVRTCLIEVKWSTATKPPKVPKRKSRRYLNEANNWIINQCKWKQAAALCQRNGWDWMIMTEKELSH